MKKKILSATALVAFLNLFLFQRNGAGTLALAGIASAIFILAIFGTKPTRTVLALAAILATTIGTSLLFAGYLPRFLAFVALWGSLLVAAYLLGTKKTWVQNEIELAEIPIAMGLSWLGGIAEILKATFAAKQPGDKLPIIRGILLGLPIAGIIAALLAAGDPIYGFYARKVFSWAFWQQPLIHLIFSLFAAALIVPTAMMKVFKLPHLEFIKTNSLAIEIKIAMAMISAVLASFLAVQWKYIFANVPQETSLAIYGVSTFSEYATRGFGEFLLVSAIIYAAVFLGRNYKLWRILLTGEYLIFFASMLRRIYLYQAFHGWTLARIYGGIFLIWLAGMALLATKFKAKSIWSSAILAIVLLFNAEGWMLHKPPTVNGRVDYVYLSGLSAAGYKGWLEAAHYSQSVLEKEYPPGIISQKDRREIFYAGIINQNLQSKYNQLESNYAKQGRLASLLIWNWQEAQAWNKMKQEIPAGKLDILRDRQAKLQARIMKQPESKRNAPFDISLGSNFIR